MKEILEATATSPDRVTEVAQPSAASSGLRPRRATSATSRSSDIVFDAPTTQGGSGGPVFNKHGEGDGGGVRGAAEFGGNSFGVPIAYALELLAGRRRTPAGASQ